MEPQLIDIKIDIAKIDDQDYILSKVQSKHPQINYYKIRKRSLDARQKRIVFLLRLEISEQPIEETPIELKLNRLAAKAKKILVIGAGPAGYFAALKLISLGLQPIVLDRGKDVRRRRRDLRSIQQEGIVNPHSNYCFGEGGAGTYSDGKLYTRAHKRGNIKHILEILVAHGANPDILIDAHPHIGSNKLPNIITAIRERIESCGGQVIFDCHVVDFEFNDNAISAAISADGSIYKADSIILATGHSARDIFYLLDKKGIRIEAKDFALGVRIEHPQKYIDQVQYGHSPRHKNLPAAAYKLACQVDGSGVFSFCMCPGGLIVPAATAPGEIVVNGMSLSRRDSPFANSGLVTAISIKELNKYNYKGVFAGLDFQRDVERKVFAAGDGSQKAPAQRALDFVNSIQSDSLNASSYIPGLHSSDLNAILPDFVTARLKTGLNIFSNKMKSYLSNEANIVATESRTSSPIRIPRDSITLMHPDVKFLFPCGEGAGYAGGILSAAMDGERVAIAVAKLVGS